MNSPSEPTLVHGPVFMIPMPLDKNGFPLWYAYIPDEGVWDREMRKLGVKHEPYPSSVGRCTFLEDGNGKSIVYVTLNHSACKTHTESEVAALIARESMHIYQDIMENIGEDRPSKELSAYYIQTIFHELYSAYLSTRDYTCES